MAAASPTIGKVVAELPVAPRPRRLGARIERWILPVYTLGVTLYLILPVVVMILFSFNDPTGRSNLTFRSFSIGAWLDPLGRIGLADAVSNSLVIAVSS